MRSTQHPFLYIYIYIFFFNAPHLTIHHGFVRDYLTKFTRVLRFSLSLLHSAILTHLLGDRHQHASIKKLLVQQQSSHNRKHEIPVFTMKTNTRQKIRSNKIRTIAQILQLDVFHKRLISRHLFFKCNKNCAKIYRRNPHLPNRQRIY